MAKIAVLGFGVVGSGTVELIYKNRGAILKKTGVDLDIKYILEIADMSGTPYADKQTKDINDILNDDEVITVAEVMGGITHAYEFTKECLKRGKSVVTSNKELVAHKGAELLKLANENNCRYLFEASVGGAIPIIRPIKSCLAANEINGLAGILNGTTNFILTKMLKEGMDFSDALALASKLGYAEKDPTDDVEGYDASRKICILSSLIFGRHVYPESVYCEGITKITAEDAAYAENWGGAVKLIGSVKELENGKILPMVRPSFVCGGNPFSHISDVFNGIAVYGDAVGEVMFYGRGAGKMPTASAVTADIINAVQTRGESFPLEWEECSAASSKDYIADYQDGDGAFYVRVQSMTEKQITELFGAVEFLTRASKPEDESAFITPSMTERVFNEKIAQIKLNLLNKIKVFEE
ncbi:MAG: homoserine dehydrogenase [Oscillospiraceae bacterium]|nr:homoserine dehydrogenase [Oscillospiraceae bacterium]